VRVGCQVAQEFADRLESANAMFAQQDSAGPAAATAEQITKLAEEFLLPGIVTRWREFVFADVKADPFTGAEQMHRHGGDDATIAYGSTLLLAMVLHGWLILAQIGDGDVVGVRGDGRAIQPVPADPQLDGLVTTSLCGSDPLADFRVAAIDTEHNQLAAVLLATDGYGNAQVVEEWPSAFSQDLTRMLRDIDVNWLASQLPSWAARCASSDGSADDTTVALLLSPATTARKPGGRDAEAGSEETTIPVVPHADTVPIQLPDAPPPPEPITLRQLAHRPAREPVVLERSTPRRRPIQRPEPHEPATTEIPKLRLGTSGTERADHDLRLNAAGNVAGEEPPTAEWPPRGPRSR
jgi:hypothetical protein